MGASFLRRRVPQRLFLAGLFAVLLFVFIYRIASWEEASMPPASSDAADYDNIAVQIAGGQGFALDDTDRRWRTAYVENNIDGLYDSILSRTRPLQTTTYRPPLLPLALAATYRIFGRSFFAWRMIECVLIATALTLVCSVAWTVFGSRVALVTAGLTLLSRTYINYIGVDGLLTEPLAVVLAALLLWLLARLAAVPRFSTAALCGLVLGLTALTRNIFVLWVPLTLLLTWRLTGKAKLAGICLGGAIVALAPWWIRNCLVLDTFMPLGTQSGVAWYAGYSDLAIAHRGSWWSVTEPEVRTAFVRELGYECDQGNELALARCTTRGARIWVRRHIGSLPRLAWWKVSGTLGSIGETGLSGRLYWIALSAPFIMWRRRHMIDVPLAIAIVAFVAVTILAIAVTWAAGWRFLVPVEPFIAVLAAVGVSAVFFGESTVARFLHAE